MVPAEHFIELSKTFKERFVESCDDNGDMPPVVLAERDGGIHFAAVCPKVDKAVGMAAARVVNSAFNPDALIVVLDAHVASRKAPPGDHSQEDTEEMARRMAEEFPPGSMMEMAKEEWPLRAGLIAATLVVIRVTKAGDVSCETLPYSYYGKGKGPFRWIDENTSGARAIAMGGNVIDSLKKIMAEPAQLDIPEIKAYIAGLDDDVVAEAQSDQARRVMEEAGVKFLQSKGCLCLNIHLNEGEDSDPDLQ